jgi:hypothetical protein
MGETIIQNLTRLNYQVHKKVGSTVRINELIRSKQENKPNH